MPAPVVVKPGFKLDEVVVKAAGVRYRKRKGVWCSVSIQWVLDSSEITLLRSMLEVELLDATAFELSLDNGATYRYAQLSKDPAGVPLSNVNVALDVTLEFEFRDRVTSYPSPLHQGV
jgi:hypothetical protein